MESHSSECAKIVAAVILPNLGGFAGSFATRKAVKTWYKDLRFPPGRPPSWVFAPMWTGLYCGIGYASYLVYKNGGGFSGDAKLPLMVYGTQLALNWAWSPIFFVKKDFGLATAEIAATSLAAATCALLFYNVDKTAGMLFIPYLAWLSYASYLCHGVWKRNKGKEIKEE